MAKSSKLSTRVSGAALAPLNGPKLKKRPRGKPFTPGHSVGAATRFKKGDVHNPHGRPATAKYSEALRALLALGPAEPIPSRTNAEKLAAVVFQLAVKERNLGAVCEVGDRAEGRAATSLYVSSDNDPLRELCQLMVEEGRRAGPPEGMVRLRKGEKDDSGRSGEANGE